MLSRRQFIAIGASAPLTAAFLRPAAAATPEFFATDGVAIHGTDPVAYFTEGRPVDGDPEIGVKWGGAVWLFASAANRAAFEANPRAYTPQFGGYCAYAMSKGAIATTVPEAWTVHGGKLFLNFSTGVRTIWKQDIPGNIVAANGYWPQILG